MEEDELNASRNVQLNCNDMLILEEKQLDTDTCF